MSAQSRPLTRSASLPAVLALAVAAGWAAPVPAQVMYTIRDLGTFGGPGSNGRGINASGQVTGLSYDTADSYHAFRTAPGGTLSNPAADLGTLGGARTSGLGINASGQVAGFSELMPGSTITHAFRTTATGRVSDPGTDLGTFVAGSNVESHGLDINASGQVTGNSTFANLSNNHAFRTTATGTLSDAGADLGTLGGNRSFGLGINASGQVAGYSWLAGETVYHAFRTTATGTLSDPGADLGTLGGADSQGRAINDSGQVTGDSVIAGAPTSHAFRSSPNGQPVVLTDLGVLPGLTHSRGSDINSLGVVVGSSLSSDGNLGRAFIYDTQMRDLNDLIPAGSGWLLLVASGINDFGLITGTGMINGEQHAFVLTPVPEPSSLALAGSALISGWIVRRRQAKTLRVRSTRDQLA